MIAWTITFILMALISGALGFTGLAGESTELARTFFWVSLLLILVTIVAGAGRSRLPRLDD